MNEELAKSIYDSNGGNAMFGDYQAYLTALNSNPKYVAHIYNKYGSKNFGSQSEFEGSLKKKEPTQASSGSGSNQTQQSSGSQPSQGKSVMEQAAEIVSGPKKTTLSQVEEVEAGTAAPAEFGLEGIRKIKGPSIEAVSESTAPKMPGYINMAQQEAEKTQAPKDNVFEYKATPQEQAQIKTDKANRVAYAQEQKKAADYNYNNLNKELYDIYEGNDVTGIESQLNKIETDYKNGAFAGREDEYQALKTDLFNRRANSYGQLENKYLDILREDEPSKYKEYIERRAGILKDLNEAGYASWDDYQLKRDLKDQKTGAKRDLYSNIDDSFDVVDKADQNFLRTLRMEAINQVSAPNVNGEGNYIPGLGTGFTSAGTIEKFHKDTQPIMSDYEALMNENAAFERDYQAGKYTPEDANAKYQELKLKEQGLSTRLNQVKKESGVTDYDLQRYDLSMRKQGALGATYETGFKDLKATEDAIRTEQENRQRWVAENPVLGTLTYFAPTVWKEFSNMAVLEAGKSLKPLGETFGLGDGYGWTDAMYYGIKDVQENREALYGYGGQDINGDGVPDDLPGFAKYGQVLAQGLGSVGAFMIPGTYASNLFKGSSLGMRSARFATNWAGGFLMMEGPAYDEALRAGLSNEDAARSATLIATLQSAAEQLVPDIKYLEAPVTRAGILSMVKAGVPYDQIMSNGMKYLQDLSTSTVKSSFKEAGEEVVGQFATDVGKTISNDAFVRTTHFNMNDPMHPEYSTKPYDNTWELKNYTDAAIGGALTGGFMTGIKGATRTYTKNEMEALSYMGKNWKDILANIEKTESNGVNRGDESFKEIEKDLKGVSTLYQSLQSMPGFKDLTKANQDMVLSLAFQKKNIQENVKNIGVELPSVKESLANIDNTINAYMTGQLDYGADKPVSYIDDNLAAMGVALVSVNPDGTYNISPKNIEGIDPDSIVKKAEEYIQKNIKDTAFADSFYHPKTDRDALQESKTESVLPSQPQEVGETGGQRPGVEPSVQGEEVTQEGGKKEEIATPDLEIQAKQDEVKAIDTRIEEIAKENEGKVYSEEAFKELNDLTARKVELESQIAAPKVEATPTPELPTVEAPTLETPVVEAPTTEAKPAAGVRAVKPKVFDAARKNTLLAKFKNDSGKRALVSSIDRAANAIRQAYGNVPIYVHETTADMQAATAITGGATMSRTGAGTFQYDADGNVIAVHVNLAKAGTDTAPHEFTHLILMDAFGDNPKLFKEFKDRIIKALSASRVAELEAFANQYTDENVKPEEFIAQLAGVMTANREKLTPTMAQKIMNLINEFISRITKGKLIPFKGNARTKDLMDFFNTVSSAMATGQGGENIIAAAQKAGSKFETAKKPTEEAGARDRSKEAIVGQVGVETAADDIAMQDLDVAKQMEAANRAAQDIKSATGWEVGADGQWRYEYPDVELNDDIADDFDVLFYLQENAKREGVRVRPNEMYPPAPLNRILDFGKLEQAYPYIDEITFAVNPNLGGAAAIFRPDRNLIEFGPDAIKNEGVEGFRRTLIHEIQHYVQEREGFEGGSSITYEADKLSKSQDVYKIPGLQLNGSANVGEAVKNGTKEILDMMDNGITVTDIMEGNYDKNKYSGNPEAILKHTANEGDAEGLDEMAASDLEGAKKIVENAINRNAIADVAYQEYRATAGEVEARNAEERSRIPYAERLYGKTLESTEDVARRNQVLESARKAVSAMDVISKKRGVSKAAEIKAQREILGENYDKAKEISDNFEDIAEKLGITKIC